MRTLKIFLMAGTLFLGGCVSFRTITQTRVDQGHPTLSGEPDPNAPVKTRKIIGIDVELPHGLSGSGVGAGLPPKDPEKEVDFLPMKGTSDTPAENS